MAGEGEESSEFLFSLLLPLFASVLAGTVFLCNHNSYGGALFPENGHWVLVTPLPFLAFLDFRDDNGFLLLLAMGAS